MRYHLLMTVLLTSACGSSTPAPAPAVVESKPVPPVPAVAPAPEAPAVVPAPVATGTPLPEGVLGVALVARPSAAEGTTTPIQPGASMVLSTTADAWAGVPRGSTFTAFAAGGELTVTYTGISEGLYGCDGGRSVTWATFTAEHPLEEGIALLRPVGSPPLEWVRIELDGTPGPTERKWTLGSRGKARLDRTEPMKAKFSVTIPGLAPFEQVHEKHLMDGADEGPIDLTEGAGIGLPTPELLGWSATGAILISHIESYEGFHYSVLSMDPTGAKVLGLESLYWCAF